MKSCLMTFQSQTQATRLRSVAKRMRIEIGMVQTPKEISYGGCSYALRFERRDAANLLALCEEYHISYSRIFLELTDVGGRRHYEEMTK